MQSTGGLLSLNKHLLTKCAIPINMTFIEMIKDTEV